MCDVRKTDCHRFSFVGRVKFNACTMPSNIWRATTMARCKCDKNHLYTWHARFVLIHRTKPMKSPWRLCAPFHIPNRCGTEWVKSFKLWRWNPTRKLCSSVFFSLLPVTLARNSRIASVALWCSKKWIKNFWSQNWNVKRRSGEFNSLNLLAKMKTELKKNMTKSYLILHRELRFLLSVCQKLDSPEIAREMVERHVKII